MLFSFAPMEGITAFPFRRAHMRCFPGTGRYYTPFITANQTYSLKSKEKKEVMPALNEGMPLVPQVMTNRAEQLVWALRYMAGEGYREVNLNLGCPSPTVTSRGKGAGFLADPEGLDRFFDEVFRRKEGEEEPVRSMRLSVKTRTGSDSQAEAAALLGIYNRYPLAEVVVHPRIRTQLYRGTPDPDAFALFAEGCVHPVAYNGDIRCAEDVRAIQERFPSVRHIMVGRGAVADPALFRVLGGGAELTKGDLVRFHGELVREWTADIPDFGNVIGKLKELWFYWEAMLDGSGRELRGIRKARTRAEYDAAVARLFASCEIKGHPESGGLSRLFTLPTL